VVGPLYRDNCFVQEDNFTWKQHITSAEDKARRKMNIMRKLAGTEWGANEKVLKSVYQGNVRPYLDGGMFVISPILCIGVDFIASVMIRSTWF
jgi:hypothetical protein